MSTRTRSSDDVEFETSGSRAGGQRSEPGGRAQVLAGGAPAAGDHLLDRPARRELSRELADEAVDRARLRRAVGELDEDERERLVEALLEQLSDGREPLSEELRERLVDGLLGELLVGRRGERDPGLRRAVGGADPPAGRARRPRSSPSIWATRPGRRRRAVPATAATAARRRRC